MNAMTTYRDLYAEWNTARTHARRTYPLPVGAPFPIPAATRQEIQDDDNRRRARYIRAHNEIAAYLRAHGHQVPTAIAADMPTPAQVEGASA